MHFKDNAWAKSRFFAHSLASDSCIVVRCKQNEGNIFKLENFKPFEIPIKIKNNVDNFFAFKMI